MEYQSLYRRYRPGTFAQVVGQDHVIATLQNAVRENRVGHAYLLSGPRGTGKTTLARILAKVLNCENPVDGEPDDTCEACRAIDAGTSFDLHELDAASNNGVEDMRRLIERVKLGTPGRTKVYLLDEVHMLSKGAENALLKTLEEPPGHVVFALATTEPHKVVPTIRSRTQHLELTLLEADQLAEHVRWIADDAGLDIDDEIIDHVIRVGGGSARDTLSALDQVVAAGGIGATDTTTPRVLQALVDNDPAAAVAAVAEGVAHGRDPRVIGEGLIGALRSTFLTRMGAPLGQLSPSERADAERFAAELSPPAITRAMEVIGSALVDMRQAADPRIDLEVALVRLTRPEHDTSVDGLLRRIAALEDQLANGVVAAAPVTADQSEASPPPAPPAPPPPPAAPAPAPSAGRPADGARAALARTAKVDAPPATAEADPPAPPAPPAAVQDEVPPSPPAPAPPTPPEPEPDPAPAPAADEVEGGAPPAEPTSVAADPPSIDQVLEAWAGPVKAAVSKKVGALFDSGQFTGIDGSTIHFAPSAALKQRCADAAGEVSAAFAATLGCPLSVVMVDGGATAPTEVAAVPSPSDTPSGGSDGDDDHEMVDPDELADAPASDTGTVAQITSTWPGATDVTESEPT